MLVTITCQYCGETVEYTKKAGRSRSICFSDACRREQVNDSLMNAFGPFMMGPKRRLRMRDIFERDNYICYLCNTPVDRTPGPRLRPLSPIVEHVQQRSVGHTMDHCRTAHRICNNRKHDNFYDPELQVLVVRPTSVFTLRGPVEPYIPFVVGEWVKCSECGSRVLKSPSGTLSDLGVVHHHKKKGKRR